MRKNLNIFLAVIIIFTLTVPTVKARAVSSEEILSETAVLINADNGQVLFDKNKDKQMYPASTTKILTGVIALEKLDMNSMITASRQAVALPYNTSHIALSIDEQITVEQALYALAIESANDAANVLAESISGTNESFSVLMNELAKQSGAINSNFTNPHGLPDSNHYTTAYDMALIAARAIQNPTFNSIFSTEKYEIPPTNKKDKLRQIWSSNYFLSGHVKCEGLIMSKTGWTEESGHTLVTAVERNGITLIAVVMNSEKKNDKWNDTVKLFDYGFNSYEEKVFTLEQIAQYIPPTITLSGGDNTFEVDSTSATGQQLKVLVHKGTADSEFSITYDNIIISENMDYIDVVASVILNPSTTPLFVGKSQFKMSVKPSAPKESIIQKSSSFSQIAPSVIIDVVTASIGAFLIWFAIRRQIIYKKRQKRNRQRIMEKRAAMNNMSVIPGTYTVNRSDIPMQNIKTKLTPEQARDYQAKKLKNQLYKG